MTVTDAERALTVGMAEVLVVLLRRNEHRRPAQAWEQAVTPSKRLADRIAAARAEHERTDGRPEVLFDPSRAA